MTSRHSPPPRRRPDRAAAVSGVLLAAAWLVAGALRADPALPPPAEIPPELAAALLARGDSERGRIAYASCAVCHGADGAGRADGTFPRLAGQHASVIAKQLVDVRGGRRENPIMLPYAARLIDAQEIADVAAFVSALSPPAGNGLGPGELLEQGAHLYRRDCARCHGEQGEGDAETLTPALAGQHYGYLLRQIRDIGSGRRGNAHPGMTALTADYPDAELRALVDYASRLAPRAAGRSGR